MVNCEFALGTYEINLLEQEDLKYTIEKLLPKCKYIDTAINYNNDYIIRKFPERKIISKIAPCHNDYYEFFMENHLHYLGRDKIDIMLIHSPRGNWQSLLKQMALDERIDEIGVSNFNISQLKAAKKILGVYPSYNEIEINPQYCDTKTIKFCKDNGIRVIAYCILGGKYNAMRFVSQYSLSYLIQFAAHFADIVIVRADNHKQINSFVDIIEHTTPLNIPFTIDNCNKSMQPMIYPIPNVQKYYKSIRTYFNEIGQNTGEYFVLEDVNYPFPFPNFEMLGDYMAYFRYIYNINDTVIYDNDLLKLDDKLYLQFYMTDKQERLTKVNIDAKCHLKIITS